MQDQRFRACAKYHLLHLAFHVVCLNLPSAPTIYLDVLLRRNSWQLPQLSCQNVRAQWAKGQSDQYTNQFNGRIALSRDRSFLAYTQHMSSSFDSWFFAFHPNKIICNFFKKNTQWRGWIYGGICQVRKSFPNNCKLHCMRSTPLALTSNS